MSMVSNIPIFITARGHNANEYNKNKEALKFSYIFISELNLFDQTYIISDNKDLLDFAIKLGFKKTIHYECKSERDIAYLEYLATYTYGKENNYYPDWIIILNINQIFITTKLLVDCINNIDGKFDIITSYTTISDRSHFFVDNVLNNRSNELHKLSSVHKREKMGDAAIYAIRSEFAFECMTYKDPTEHFWQGKIKYFENTGVYTDIYTINDIDKFKYITPILDKMKEINKKCEHF